MLVGYAHAGADDPEALELQLAALRAAGCAQLFVDTGSWRERPELERALVELRDGHDRLVVCRLDRLGRSLRDLVGTLAELDQRAISFCSLDDEIDTASPAGRPTADVLAALARFDRLVIQERTRSDVAAARQREREGRRRPRSRPLGQISGLEVAPDLIEPIVGFRHWRLVDGALTSMFSRTRWETSQMTARCPVGRHDPVQTPAPGCTCGIYAYYDPCPRTSASTRDLVGGAVVVWGRIEAHSTGLRAEHARVVGLDLPLTRGAKRRMVTEIAEHLGVPVIAHRRLASAARAHGSPLPVAMRPPRARVRATPVDPWSWLGETGA
ncbi:MAG: recombinase family protein [Solirubrobacteraceae bacterium]